MGLPSLAVADLQLIGWFIPAWIFEEARRVEGDSIQWDFFPDVFSLGGASGDRGFVSLLVVQLQSSF